MDLKSELRALGLTEQQLSAKAVEATENILASKQGVELDTIRHTIKGLENESSAYIRRIKESEKDVAKIEREISKIEEKVDVYRQATKDRIINDEKLVDTLNFFTALLSRTQEVFGAEKMTEAVIVQLLETSGYGIWRSIMGSKYDDNGISYTKRK